jgi:hypothetical protein
MAQPRPYQQVLQMIALRMKMEAVTRQGKGIFLKVLRCQLSVVMVEMVVQVGVHLSSLLRENRILRLILSRNDKQLLPVEVQLK